MAGGKRLANDDLDQKKASKKGKFVSKLSKAIKLRAVNSVNPGSNGKQSRSRTERNRQVESDSMIESSDKDQKRSNKVVTRTMASFFEEDQFVEMEAEGQRDEFMSEPEDLESSQLLEESESSDDEVILSESSQRAEGVNNNATIDQETLNKQEIVIWKKESVRRNRVQLSPKRSPLMVKGMKQ